MNSSRSGVRNTTHNAVVVIKTDAFASLDFKTSRASSGKNNCKECRGVLVLNNNAYTSCRNFSNSKGDAGSRADSNIGMDKTTKKWR